MTEKISEKVTYIEHEETSQLEQLILGKHTDVCDVLHMATIDAGLTSARYYQENMLTVENFTSDLDLLEYAILERIRDPYNLVLEFGVATGRTISFIANQITGQPIYGFDCFSGLPEDWRTGYAEGAFARDGLPPVPDNVELVNGFFKDTLPGFMADYDGFIKCGLVHIDCDLYSSTVDVLENIKNNLVSGTIIVFDEYFNYPGWQHGEFKAWQEFVEKYNINYSYIGMVSKHQQVAIRIN